MNQQWRYAIITCDLQGFVIAPRHEGGRYLPVLLMGQNRVLSFGFSIPLPDGDFDFEELDTEAIYAGEDLPDMPLADRNNFV